MKGYRSYRGRSGGRIVLTILLSLTLIAACAFLFLQRYIVYGSDGVVRFDWPWGEEKEQEPPLKQEPELVLPEPPPEKTVPDTPPAQEPQEPEELHALALDASALSGGVMDALNAVERSGCNAAVVPLKLSDGALLYEPEAARAVIEGLTISDYHAVGRITALHDSAYARAHPAEAAVQQLAYPGVVWYDHDSTFWLAPEKAEARAYVARVAADAAALGFDELLFDAFSYPPFEGNRINNIDTSKRTMTQEEALALLSGELRAAVGEDVILSVELSGKTILSGGDKTMGQSLPALAEAFDRVYAVTTEEEVAALEAALAPYRAELVPILPAPRTNGAYLCTFD